MMRPIEVLLVEDNPADADLTREALAESKLLVHLESVDDGEKAEAYLMRLSPYEHALRPDLILLDLNLPRRNGREVLKTIRGMQQLKHIPVVVLSSSDTEMDILKSYGLGANCYVVKPVRFADFFEIVRHVGEFWFSVVRLPPHDVEESGLLQATPPPAPLTTPAETPLRILVVEDNPADVDLVREYLQERRLWTLSACDLLRKALALAEQEPPDVMLLDLGLPDSQGMETLNRAVDRLPHVPIIVLTGREQLGLGPLAVRAGAQDYLEKDELRGSILSRSICYAVERAWANRERDMLLARANAARGRAEEAVLLRDEFLLVASHELKTPLTSLLLQERMLERSVEQAGTPSGMERLRRCSVAMRRQCEQLARLIDSLLDVSRITSGRLVLERSRVDLVQLVQDSMERLRSQAESARCPLHLEAGPPVFGQWDRFRLEQVVVNLLTNALKYGAGKPVDLRVHAEGSQAVLVVRDHGIGIREEDQKRIFGRFERAVPTRHFGGVGLGLYISRQIVNAHAGTIELTSRPAEGATFTVRLPRGEG
ncbi:MAG TPA: response regulator [Archangium sp.]|uniref:response regulator n=1 Tax=Archangium sp. TaxID=1872627 RepID=UPI002E31A5A6|nr:response regulator [Archangium sp.]HEX5748839.1 response regulator [Archangium sp.]